jgi:hypothetical protein
MFLAGPGVLASFLVLTLLPPLFPVWGGEGLSWGRCLYTILGVLPRGPPSWTADFFSSFLPMEPWPPSLTSLRTRLRKGLLDFSGQRILQVDFIYFVKRRESIICRD